MNPLNPDHPPLELWGGLEATVNRVQDRFFDQIVRTGHHDRVSDLDLFADLGLRTLRYPLLWERTAPDGIETAQWHWADRRLERLRELGIRPIVGLLHHGSGPRSTSLIDPAFPEHLAEYAGAVAHRYPWVTDYTPVNEPLTTARFAALYGHWYPHHRDEVSFARALLGQCRGTVLAMEAIRAVNPGARLIQTDDLGKTFSTDPLAYQADFENERRWVTYDLLTGHLTPDHTMWQWLEWIGIERHELEWFQEYACPPAIMGINTYLSSQRFLDHRIDRYPGEIPGTNGRDTYVDVPANRVVHEGVLSVDGLLEEAWQRFSLPLAVTESHNGGSREEQVRWLNDVWTAAQRARETGGDVRAVTVWALLGLYDWAHLVTKDAGLYEPGAFDVRGPAPRPTAIASMVRDLANQGTHTHPALDVPGWWHRPDRFYSSVENRPVEQATGSSGARSGAGHPVLLIGSPGPLRDAIAAVLDERKLSQQVIQPGAVDGDVNDVSEIIRVHRPWAVIDVGTAQWWSVSREHAPHCFRTVAAARPDLALACANAGAHMLLFSSDLVFDGAQQAPYTETDTVRPFERSGEHCVEAEAVATHALPNTLVIRTGPIFDRAMRPLSQSQANRCPAPRIAGSEDVISPSPLSDVIWNALELLVDQEKGVWHLASPDSISWREFASMFGTTPYQIPLRAETAPTPSASHLAPRQHVLASERGHFMPLIASP